MRNGDKIREALQRAYPDDLINVYNDFSAEEVKFYFNGQLIARFKSIFWDEDFENPKIEIKMRNGNKVMEALKEAFPGHMVEKRFIEENYNTESIFVDGKCVALFYKDFFDDDFDEIELTIKAPLLCVKDFVNRAVGYEIIRGAVERGLMEWEEESQQNS